MCFLGTEVVTTNFSFMGYFLGFLEVALHGPFASLEISTAVPLTRAWSIYLSFFFCLVLSILPSHSFSLPLGVFISLLGGDPKQNQDTPIKLSLTRGLYLVPCQDSFEEISRSQCKSTSSLSRFNCQRITHPQISQTHSDIRLPGTLTASDKY